MGRWSETVPGLPVSPTGPDKMASQTGVRDRAGHRLEEVLQFRRQADRLERARCRLGPLPASRPDLPLNVGDIAPGTPLSNVLKEHVGMLTKLGEPHGVDDLDRQGPVLQTDGCRHPGQGFPDDGWPQSHEADPLPRRMTGSVLDDPSR